MAFTNTTLSAAIGASDLTFNLTSTTGFPAVGVLQTPAQVMQIDGEKMLVQVVPVSGTVKVMQRGYDGTTASPHDILAQVTTTSTFSDWAIPAAGYETNPNLVQDRVVTIGEDTTFTASGTTPVAGTSLPLPLRDTTYLITKATACAITIISALAQQAGVELTFIAGTAQAHTITYTPGWYGDTTASDVATFTAKVGANMKTKVGYTGLLAPTALNDVSLG